MRISNVIRFIVVTLLWPAEMLSVKGESVQIVMNNTVPVSSGGKVEVTWRDHPREQATNTKSEPLAKTENKSDKIGINTYHA